MAKPENMRMSDVRSFYDELATDYHLVYEDWRQAVQRQGKVLNDLIRSQLGDRTCTILDCSCGIGTQAIGLALHAHAVHATDLSARSVERARREATTFGVEISFNVADMRKLANVMPETFDVVLSCDNSLPHLLTDDDLRTAIDHVRQKMRPGGLVVIGLRDYDEVVRTHPRSTPPQVQNQADGRTVIFQLWNWDDDGRTYDLSLFVLRHHDERWEVTCHTTRYRALLRAELDDLLTSTGFTGITWHEPESTGHHQPLVTARA
jgi:2-polyprenyl-3-methyl-5-hydroxy-6-metoxy-1,4-benzoquinol methylase